MTAPVRVEKPLVPQGQVGQDWRKPRRSMNGGNCVEAASAPGAVLVRDTKQAGMPGRTVLAFPSQAWRRFTADPEGAVR